MGKCPAWREGEQGLFSFSHDRCYATKEIEVCDCLGNEAFCNFYPEKRKAAAQPKFGEWISVKDRLPTGEDPVLILVKETEHYGYNKEKRKVYYCQYLAYWDGDEWFTTWCNGCRKISDTAKEPYADDYEVTHWMPLPEPPKEDAKDENA